MNAQFMQKEQKRLIKTIKFIEDTNEILITILQYAQSKNPSKDQIANEFTKFIKLAERSKKDGIHNMDLVYSQGRVVIETFKLFVDVCPELKSLQ